MGGFRVVSVDSGSSCLKMYDGTSRVLQPAVVKVLPDSDGHTYRDEVRVEGRRYVVGPTAQIAIKGLRDEPFIERGYHGSLQQYVQICHGLQQLGVQGHYDAIMHSLPYTEHQNDAYRRRVKARLQFTWESGGQHYEVTFGDSATMPQGVGALRLWESQAHAQGKTGACGHLKMVALVDLGSCTADFVTVEMDERTGDYQYCADKSSSLRAAQSTDPIINCLQFRNAWLRRIKSIDGMQQVAWGYHELMNLPINGSFWVRSGPGDLVDLEPSYAATACQFTHDVACAIRQVLADVWHKVDKIILTGGGSALLNMDAMEDDRVERLNLWANAEGQYVSAQKLNFAPDVARLAGGIHANPEHQTEKFSRHVSLDG